MDADLIEFRNALGLFATGVTIITAIGPDGRPIGMTANSFNSVSLEPKLVLWSLAKSSGLLEAFAQASGYCIHILAQDQVNLSNTFARPSEDRFDGVDWLLSENGFPLIQDCVASFECASEYQYEGGDHIIFVGRVLQFATDPERPVLGFHKGRYIDFS